MSRRRVDLVERVRTARKLGGANIVGAVVAAAVAPLVTLRELGELRAQLAAIYDRRDRSDRRSPLLRIEKHHHEPADRKSAAAGDR